MHFIAILICILKMFEILLDCMNCQNKTENNVMCLFKKNSINSPILCRKTNCCPLLDFFYKVLVQIACLFIQ